MFWYTVLAIAQPQKEEKSNMDLVGYNDLQARSAYQPTIHQQGQRWIAYIGHHGGSQLNPAHRQAGEQRHLHRGRHRSHASPISRAYSRRAGERNGNAESGGAQMVRVCDGSELPHADKSKVYMLRTFGGCGTEIWDVTDPAKPSRLTVVVSGLVDTHKSWWECDTGIAYLVSGVPGWRVRRMTQIYDLSDPAKPVFIRNFGLPGQQPGSTGPAPTELHGAISTGPQGNRVYFGYGTNANGIMQIVDRDKLLNGRRIRPTRICSIRRLPARSAAGRRLRTQLFRCSAWSCPNSPSRNRPLRRATGKSSGPARFRSIVPVKHLGNECLEDGQMVRIFDITDEMHPLASPPGRCPKPAEISANAAGALARIRPTRISRRSTTGASCSSRTSTPACALSMFAIRSIPKRSAITFRPSPTRPTSAASAPAPTQHCKVAIQTNNVEVDDRGYIYIVDRANTGMHILELTGAARRLANSPTLRS